MELRTRKSQPRSYTYGKRQKVTKATDRATLGLIQRNRLSPFLSLPGEVRERILRSLIGDRVIHIFAIRRASVKAPPPVERQRAAICRVKDASARESSLGATSDHQDCHDSEECGLQGRIAISAACRQLYEETNHVLWSTNVFTFRDADDFSAFSQALSKLQRSKVAHLHLYDARGLLFSPYNQLDNVLNGPILPSFAALNSLTLSLDHCFRNLGYLDEITFPPTVESLLENMQDILGWLRLLPAPHVHVELCHFHEHVWSSDQGADNQKSTQAETICPLTRGKCSVDHPKLTKGVEDFLLNPAGAELQKKWWSQMQKTRKEEQLEAKAYFEHHKIINIDSRCDEITSNMKTLHALKSRERRNVREAQRDLTHMRKAKDPANDLTIAEKKLESAKNALKSFEGLLAKDTRQLEELKLRREKAESQRQAILAKLDTEYDVVD